MSYQSNEQEDWSKHTIDNPGQPTLAREGVNDLLLNTLLALGQTLVLYARKDQIPNAKYIQNLGIVRQTLPTAIVN